MALHADPVQAQQHGSIVTARIDAHAERVQRRPGEQAPQARQGRGRQCLFQELTEQHGRAFGGLQRDIAGEAVGDDDVDGAGADVVSLDETVKADGQVGPLQGGGGVLDGLVALEAFGADVENADRRLLQAQDVAREDLAHDGELHQVVGVAFHVRTEVEHDAFPAPGRKTAGDGGTVDARQHLEGEHGHGHQRPGVAGGNQPRRLARADGVDGEAHTRIAPGAQGQGRFFVVADHAVGVAHLGCAIYAGEAVQQRRQAPFVAKEQEVHLGKTRQREVNPFHDHLRGVVTTHGVQG